MTYKPKDVLANMYHAFAEGELPDLERFEPSVVREAVHSVLLVDALNSNGLSDLVTSIAKEEETGVQMHPTTERGLYGLQTPEGSLGITLDPERDPPIFISYDGRGDGGLIDINEIEVFGN